MTSVPSLTRVEKRSGRRFATSAGRIRTRLTPWVRASRQAFSFGNMPPETICCFSSAGICSEGEPAHDVAVCALDSGDIGEEDEGVGLGANGAGGGHLIGVDVVVLAVEAEGDGGDDRDSAHGPDGFEPLGVHGGDLTDEAEVGIRFLLAGAEDVAVAAREADGGLTVRADSSDEGLVDPAGEDHQGGVAGLGVGDAQAGDELTFFAHLSQRASQLHSSAVDDGDLISIGDEVSDRFTGGVEDLLVLKSGTAEFDDESHSKPSSSFHPHIRFMFWTA